MKCSKCNKYKVLEEFQNDKRVPSGKKHICKDCWNVRAKKYRTSAKVFLYNKAQYNRVRKDVVRWEKQLRYQRERYRLYGRLKYPNKCIVCSKIFQSVRKDKKFCSNKCLSGGEHNGNWSGGRFITSRGYVMIYSPHHPNAYRNHYPEHRLVMEKFLERFLKKCEQVHHINFNRSDNRLENLMYFKNAKEHTNYHYKIGRDEMGDKIDSLNR